MHDFICFLARISDIPSTLVLLHQSRLYVSDKILRYISDEILIINIMYVQFRGEFCKGTYMVYRLNTIGIILLEIRLMDFVQ